MSLQFGSLLVSAEMDTFGTRVWKKVRDEAIKYDPEHWTNTEDSTCEVCNTNQGYLVRCHEADCKEYCHVGCVAGKWGLELYEDNHLKVYCEFHHGDVTFCKCESLYDHNVPMVACDKCSEWYHCRPECSGLKISSAAAADFTCQRCTELGRQGKHVSAALKKKNMLKESKSTAQLEGNRVFFELIGIIADIGNVIDAIKSNNELHSPQQSTQAKRLAKALSEEDVQGVLNVFSETRFDSIGASRSSGGGNSAGTMVGDVLPLPCAEVCDLSDILTEYKQYTISCMTEIQQWREEFDLVLSGAVECMCSVLVEHDVTIPTATASAVRRTPFMSDAWTRVMCLFNSGLYNDLCGFADKLVELTGAEQGKHTAGGVGGQVQPDDSDGGQGMDVDGGNVSARTLFNLSVKPVGYDSCKSLVTFVSWLAWSFEIIHCDLRLAGTDSVGGTVANEDMSNMLVQLNDSYHNGNGLMNSQILRDKSSTMVEKYGNFQINCRGRRAGGHSSGGSSALMVNVRAIFQLFYSFLQGTSRRFETWYEEMAAFVQVATNHTDTCSSSSTSSGGPTQGRLSNKPTLAKVEDMVSQGIGKYSCMVYLRCFNVCFVLWRNGIHSPLQSI